MKYLFSVPPCLRGGIHYLLAPVFFALVLVSHHFASRGREETEREGLELRGSETEAGFLRHESYSLYLPGPTALKVGTLGNTSLAADYVWLKSVQYVSREFGEEEKWRKCEWLKRMYETVLELDPQWIQAVRLGGLLLGAFGRGTDEATSVLIDGMFENPDSWILPYEAGMAFLFDPRRAGEAAKFLEIARTRKSCPPGRRRAIENVLPELNRFAGREKVALTQAEELAERYAGTPLGEASRRKAIEIRALLKEKQLTLAVAHFGKMTGRHPSRLEKLVEAGIMKRVPKEPFGLRWFLNPRTGQVRSEGRANLYAYRAIRAFKATSGQFLRAKGRYPRSLDELLDFGRTLLRTGGLPAEWERYFETSGADPIGRPYEFDPEKGEVILPEEYAPEKLFPRPLKQPDESIESPGDR